MVKYGVSSTLTYLVNNEGDLIVDILTKVPLWSNGIRPVFDSNTLDIYFMPVVQAVVAKTEGNIAPTAQVLSNEMIIMGESYPMVSAQYFRAILDISRLLPDGSGGFWDGCYMKTKLKLSGSTANMGDYGVDVRGNVSVKYTLSEVSIVWTNTDSPASSGDIKDQTDKITDSQDKTTGAVEDVNETGKGIWASLKDFFGSFFQNLINAVVSLFVPSAEEMGGLFDQLNQFFSDRFGFLYAPFDYMIRLMQVFLSSTGTTGLTLPGFSIMGEQVWPDLTYDLSSDPLVGTVCGYVRMGTGTLLAGYFIMYLQHFFKERFGSG